MSDPYYFLVTQDYVIGTPRGIQTSPRVMDIPFNEFAEDIELQDKLHLLSTALARPWVHPPIASPMHGEELRHGVAIYLSSFTRSRSALQRNRDYLLGNGTVRILLLSDKLRQELSDRLQ